MEKYLIYYRTDVNNFNLTLFKKYLILGENIIGYTVNNDFDSTFSYPRELFITETEFRLLKLKKLFSENEI